MRRLSANYIFDGYRLYKNSILVLNDKDEVVELINTHGDLKESEGVEFYNGILCPGFVNAHCHLELSHLKGKIEKGGGLQNFVRSIVSMRQAEKDVIFQAVEKADFEMRTSGIVAAGDISNTDDTIAVKKKSRISYYNFFEIFDLFNPDLTTQAFYSAMGLFHSVATEIPSSVVPHAPYSCSPGLFNLLHAFHEDRDCCISIHNQETVGEDEMFLKGSGSMIDFFSEINPGYKDFTAVGKSSCQAIVDMLIRGKQYMFVHNTFSQEQDLVYANEQLGADNCFWCLCPRSNKYIENSQPDYDLFIRNKSNVVIGTDSLASNDDLSIIEELKLVHTQNDTIDLETTLSWLTINGAKSLKKHDNLGSFEPGKTPGVNLIEYVDLQNLRPTEKTRVKVLV